ncbi:hypothetical protein NDU88_006191 [Pleurodeles waltl]|uniref:Uncharacterized protein n=1 Tax=Pleurodeles waltl TaxID=8319 RepID=A0AAV7UM36_PLEWA|nr:hypothetical protein NDU88_006191 [Pleurodeles waltl]
MDLGDITKREAKETFEGMQELRAKNFVINTMVERLFDHCNVLLECLGRLLKPTPMPPVTLTNALIMRDVVTQQLMDIDISDNAPSSVNTVDFVNERNDAHYSNSRPIYEHVR